MSHFTFTRAANELSLSNHLLGTFLTEIGYEVPRSDRIAQIPVKDVEKWRNHPWVKAQSGVPPPHHITAEEAATRLGVTKYRVCDLMSDGKLRGHSFGPRRVVRVADVERYLNTRQKRTPPQLVLKPGQMSRAQVCERLGISGRTLMDEVVNPGYLEIIARHGLATIFSAEQVEQFAQTKLARRFDRSVPEGFLSVAAAAKVLRVDEDQVHGFIVKYGLPHVTVRRAHCPELAATKALAKRFATRRRAHAGKEIDGFLSGAKVLRRYKLGRFQLERLIAEFAIETKRIEHRLYVGPFPKKAEDLAKDMAEANSYLSGRVKGWRIAAKVRKSLGITTSQEDALVERNVLQRKTLDCHAFLSTPTEEARAAAKAFRTELSVIRGEAPSKLLDTNKLCETLGVQRGDLPALIELGLIRETKSFRRKVYDRPTKQEIEQIEAWKRAKAEIQTEIETLSNDTNMQTVLAFRREHGLSQAQIGLLIRENIVVVKRVGERIFIPKQTDEVLETVQFRARARAIEKGTPKKEDRNLRTAERMEARLGLTTPTFRTIREAGLIPTKTIGEKMFYSMPDQSAQARIKELKVGYRLNTSKSGKTGEYVTARYAANALGISDDARRHLVKHGVLHKQRFGRAVGFRKAD
ncbi:MAG: helix-turn-helix domain-containing protein, partial [Deltaproteobacteria bacterium]|nr:helix-turn-helix domain-containing protein [Deltaproteobacteria bacterium]